MLKRVRGGFVAHLHGKAYPSGTELDLTEEEIALVAHQLEDVLPPESEPRAQRRSKGA